MSELVTIYDGPDVCPKCEGMLDSVHPIMCSRCCGSGRELSHRRPAVVCLCGSTRFYEAFQRANFEETMAGKIVLSVGFYAGSPGEMVRKHGEGVGITPEQKEALDQLHMRKIDLADEILVLNVGGYIGESTRREIVYARQHRNKRIRYLEEPANE